MPDVKHKSKYIIWMGNKILSMGAYIIRVCGCVYYEQLCGVHYEDMGNINCVIFDCQ